MKRESNKFSLFNCRFHQENVLATVLSQVDGSSPVVKRVPPLSAPTIALDIRRHALAAIRSRKGNFQCQHSIEITTFTLPSGMSAYSIFCKIHVSIFSLKIHFH